MHAIRPLLIGLAVLVGLALVIGVIVVFLAPRAAVLPAGPPDAEGPAPTWAPPAEPPSVANTPSGGISGVVDPNWVAFTSSKTGIPERALAAYAGAALVKSFSMPDCGISWNTLAAIGAVESDHGCHG